MSTLSGVRAISLQPPLLPPEYVVPTGELHDRTLNGARRDEGYRRLGYLSTAEFGYALACYCWVRGEAELPGWARHVNPGPRLRMEQGLAYLRRTRRRPAPPPALTKAKHHPERPVESAHRAVTHQPGAARWCQQVC